jgi:undecaprenyl pyrophosphate synthase
MTTVRVLIDAVGEYNAGDIVKDAPVGLVHMATVGTRNAATGELIAELIDGAADAKSETGTDGLKELKAKAKELKIDGYGKMTVDELKVAIETAEKGISDAAEFKELQSKAAELEIIDAETMSRDELVAEIALVERMKELHSKAAELQIVDFEKMSPDELVAAIADAEKAKAGGSGEQ